MWKKKTEIYEKLSYMEEKTDCMAGDHCIRGADTDLINTGIINHCQWGNPLG